MEKFIVPQFIEMEPKVFGPLSVRQFIMLTVAGVVLFLIFKLVNNFLFFLLMVVVIGGGTTAFAFVKINGAPFHEFLINIFTSLKKPSLRVWNKNLTEDDVRGLLNPVEKKEEDKKELETRKKLSQSRLEELSMIVDTHGQYKGEKKNKKNVQEN